MLTNWAIELNYAQQLLSTYSAYTPYGLLMLISFVAYATASNAGLRVWIALQRAPMPTPLPEDAGPDTKSAKKMSKMVHFSTALSITLSLVAFFALMPRPALSGAGWKLLLFPQVSFAVYRMLGFTTGLVSWSARRRVSGEYDATHSLTGPDKTERVFFVLSIVTTSLAMWSSFKLYSWLALLAVVFETSRACSTGKISLGRVIGIGGVLSLMSFGLVGAGLNVALSSEKSMERMQDVLLDVANQMSATSYYYLAWVFPAIAIAFPGILLSVALRIDYKTHVDSMAEPSDIVLQVVPFTFTEKVLSGKPSLRRLLLRGDAVALPSRAPTGFPKVYYRTAFCGWIASQVAMLGLVASLPIDGSLININAKAMYTIIFTPYSFCVMAIWVCGRSLARGEFKKIFSYRESWKAEPAKAVANAEQTEPTEKEKEKVELEELLIVV